MIYWKRMVIILPRKFIAAIFALCFMLMTACGQSEVSSEDSSDITTTAISVEDTTVSPTTITTSSEHPSGTTSTVKTTKKTTTTNKTTTAPADNIPYEKPPTINRSNLINPQSGGYDAQAQALRKSIVNSPDKLKIVGDVYYISYSWNDSNSGTSKVKAWRTINAYNENRWILKSGDTVLFERGGVYRGTLHLISGVTYGAYGSGPKPNIYGSVKNYADEKLWKKSSKNNVWEISVPGLLDVGNIVFDHVKAVGIKRIKGISELNKDFLFYHDHGKQNIYLYLSKGNPGKLYSDIEFSEKKHVLNGGSATNVTIDNLCVMYGGAHGIQFVSTKDIKITNCEIGWIGGSIQKGDTQYGNGIEFWNDCENILVENNWVYQCYDAGITHQGDPGSIQKNVVFRGNLVEYCVYALEFFLHESEGLMENITYENNVLRFAGYGFGFDRSYIGAVSLVNGWGHKHPAVNFNIRNNVFDLSNYYLIVLYYNGPQSIKFNGNTYYQKGNRVADWSERHLRAKSQSELEKQIAKIESSPKLVKYLG